MTYYSFFFTSKNSSFKLEMRIEFGNKPHLTTFSSKTLIAYLKNSRGILPLLTKKDGKIIFEDFISDFILSVLNEKAFLNDFYIWRYLPANYRIIPLWFRSSISKFIIKRKSGFRDGTEIKPFLCFLNFLRQKGFDFKSQELKIFFLRNPILLLSHDVESEAGFDFALKIADIEESYGFKSTWFIVTGEYKIREDVLKELLVRGHRIGWHELKHDNKFPFICREKMKNRIEKSLAFIDKYNVKGFRSPSYLSSAKMLGVIKEYFTYDSSRLDYDIISGNSPKGCFCSYPFILEAGLLEIPITLPFELPFITNGFADNSWDDKLELLIADNALIHANTHPDPDYLGNKKMMERYELFLSSLKQRNIKNMMIEDLVENINVI